LISVYKFFDDKNDVIHGINLGNMGEKVGGFCFWPGLKGAVRAFEGSGIDGID
jgi:hypothetical protein